MKRESERELQKRSGDEKIRRTVLQQKLRGFRSRLPAPKKFSGRCLCRLMSTVKVICTYSGPAPEKSYSRCWCPYLNLKCVDSGPAPKTSLKVDVCAGLRPTCFPFLAARSDANTLPAV